MEQANKPTFLQIATSGVLAGLCLGIGRIMRTPPTTKLVLGLSTFMVTIGWLLLIGAVVLMVLWAAKSVRS